GSQRRLGDSDRVMVDQVVTLAPETLIAVADHLDEQASWGAADTATLTPAAQTQPGARSHTRWDLHGDTLISGNDTRAEAVGTCFFRPGAQPVAIGASGHRHHGAQKRASRRANLARSPTSHARNPLGPRGGAVATTRLARPVGPEHHFGLGAEGGVDQ